MPPTLAVTEPTPLPVGVIVTRCCATSKLAVTELSSVSVNEQVGVVPLQAPPQPAKVAPVSGVAVRVTSVPIGNAAMQVVPQSIIAPPALFDATVPVLVPLRTTVIVAVGTPSIYASTGGPSGPITSAGISH